RKQRDEDRTQTGEERGGVIEVPVCDLVRDQEDAGRAHDHDEDVAHSGVVVDTERTARMRVAAKGKPVREHEPEWKHDAESADAEAHHEIRAHVLRLTRLLRRFWTRSNVRHGPQETGHRHVPTPWVLTERILPYLATKAEDGVAATQLPRPRSSAERLKDVTQAAAEAALAIPGYRFANSSELSNGGPIATARIAARRPDIL